MVSDQVVGGLTSPYYTDGGNLEIREIPKGYNLEPPEEPLVSYWALFGSTRQYVIDFVKAPLQKAIERARTLKDISGALFSAIKKIPLISKKNTSFINTHILLEKEEMFLKYHINSSRQKLLESAFKVFIFEYEHDGYYAFLGDWMVIELAMELAKGNWIPRFSKFPIKGCWTGPDLPDLETIRQNMREALNERFDTEH